MRETQKGVTSKTVTTHLGPDQAGLILKKEICKQRRQALREDIKAAEAARAAQEQAQNK